MKRFAKTVVKVLMAYADLLKNDFHNHLKDERTVGMNTSKIYIFSISVYFELTFFLYILPSIV